MKILKVSMACVALSTLISGFFPQPAAGQMERREMQKVQPAPSGGQGRTEQCQGLSITTPTELPAGKMNAPYSKQIQVERSDNALSNPETTGFEGGVEYMCVKHSGIISGSDGSKKQCTPFTCTVDITGVPRCIETCTSNADCASGSVCSAESDCRALINQ